MSSAVAQGRAFDDDRGRLVPVEFHDVPFVPQRAFVVLSTQGPAARGGHRADCRELIVLVSGGATVTVTPPGGESLHHRLESAGDRLLIDPDVTVDYTLESTGTTVLVLADRAYDADRRGGE